MIKWQKYLIAVLFILIGTWAYYLSVGIKNNSAALKTHNHDDRYYLDSEVEDRLRFLRNDIKFYIDHEKNMIKAATELLERLDIDELENNER